MFKTANKTLTQQRAVLKPMKSTPVYEEEDEDIEDQDSFMDDDSSCYSNTGAAVTSDTRNETMLLAQFLATTGPDEYEKADDKKKKQQFNRASRLLKRLRKKPTMAVLRGDQISETTATTNERKTHIPLPVHDTNNESSNNDKENLNFRKMSSTSCSIPKANKQQPSSSVLRDSGVYSETNSEKESYLTSTYESVPPLPPFTSMLSDIQFPHPPPQHKPHVSSPRRPAPVPPSITAIMSTSTSTKGISESMNTADRIRSVPEAALKRRSVRLRHVQVQTSTEPETDDKSTVLQEREEPLGEDKQACPHCRQVITKETRNRRTSCPPALASGLALLPQKDLEDSKVLLAMIMKLKSQLEEEKLCRIKLEKAMHQQQKKSDERREQLAREKDKWADNCVWLDDRLAFLPE